MANNYTPLLTAQSAAVRKPRYALVRNLKSGATDVCEVLSDPPEFTLTMTIYDLLIAQRGYGRYHVLRVLNPLHISELRKVGDLTERQRELLISRIKHGVS